MAKLQYASTFPTEISLILMERKSDILQHMFMDCLEVEDNISMSKNSLDRDNDDKVEKNLHLVERCKKGEAFPVHHKSSPGKQRNDQLQDAKEDSPTSLFLEKCNHPIANSTSGDFKREFKMPIYDEYEDECLDVISIELAMGSKFVNEEKLTIIQN